MALKLQSIPLIVPAVGPPKIGTIADLALNPILLQRWAKEWALGCANSPQAAGGSQKAGFTQPRAPHRTRRRRKLDFGFQSKFQQNVLV